MESPLPETDLRPPEFGAALLMAATWYFLGPWGLIPTNLVRLLDRPGPARLDRDGRAAAARRPA